MCPASDGLPPETTSFVGRAAQVELVADLARTGSARLVTIIGPAGVGKTRLAARVARSVSELSTIYCDLSAARTRAELLRSVAAELELSPVDGGDAALTQLEHALDARDEVLLILDNFEQLVDDAAEVVGELVERASALRVLVTSRVPLYLEGERRVQLEPMSAHEGSELFAERAAAILSDFTIDDEQRLAIERLVERVDGLPLAIELAAARVSLMTPQQICERLRSEGAIGLRAPRRDRPARHASLDAAIGWSWQLLSTDEQRALAACTVFCAGFTVEAAEAVTGGGLELFAGLVDKSLLRRRRSSAAVARLDLFEGVREYVLQHGALDDDDTDALRGRHARYFCDYVDSWAAQVCSADAAQAIEMLDAERENAMAAARWLARRDPARMGALVLGLDHSLTLRGPFDGQRALLDEALSVCDEGGDLFAELQVARANARRRSGDIDGALNDATAVLGRLDASQLALRAAALRAKGRSEGVAGRYAEAEATLRAARDAASDARAQSERAYALADLGNVVGNPEPLLEALAAFEALGDVQGRAHAHFCLGRALRDQHDVEQALFHLDQALALADALGERRLQALVISNRANAHHIAGQLDQALVDYRRAANLHARNGHRMTEGWVLTDASCLLRELGREADAQQLLARALDIARRAGDDAAYGLTLGHMARAAADRGHADRARTMFAQAREILARLGSAWLRTPLDILEGLEQGADDDERWHPVAVHLARRLAHRGPQPRVDGTLLRIDRASHTVTAAGAVIALADRQPLRRLVEALVDHHRRDATATASADALINAGWPGERIDAAAASNRLRNAIATLRRLGLREVIQTRRGGYRLDPRCRIDER